MMKLRRKFSGVLPSKKPNSDLPSHIVPLTTITEVDIDEPIPEDWHESQLQDAVIESLRDQHQSLERDLTTKNGEITQLRQQLDRDGEEKAQRDALVEFNARLQKELRETVMRMTTENEMLRREHDRQISEHNKMVTEQLNTIKEYQIYAVNMSEDHIRLQGQVNSLNSDRTSLLLSMDRPLAEAVNGEATAVQKARAMEAELAQARSQIEQIATLKTRNNELTVKVTNLETELSEVREAAEVKAEEHTKAIIAAKGSVLGMDPTPRAILSFKMLSKGFQETVVTDRPEVTLFMRVCSLETLTNQSLDMRLSQNQAERFANSVTSDDLALLVCDLCQLPKLRRKPGAEHSLRISEFPSMAQATSCCSKNICTTCYLAGITASLYTNWWNSLSRRNWINCPAHNCSSPVLGRGTPESLLQELGDSQIRVNMDMYNRIRAFRGAWRRLRVDEETLAICEKIHLHLIQAGKMHPLLDLEFKETIPDEAGRLQAFDPRKTSMVSVDHNGSSINVPLFISFLRRHSSESAKDCAFCTEKTYDIDIGSPTEWLGICNEFRGDWTWKLLLFPVKMGMSCHHDIGFCRRDIETCSYDVEYCRHDIDFCTGCLQRHLETQLEQHGRSGCDRLTCPSDGCRRLLDYNEVQLYAKNETFQTYDKYLYLNHLSQDPTFRWCLRQGCTNGDLYDDSGGPKVQCGECAFEMCHEHCVPWHEGQTCAQYDSIKEHGDPDFQKTADWIEKNTKPCPNCRQNIQKGEACFHMTCSQCHAEYCWECLADWSNINPSPGEHNANAHGEGCPFRTNGLTPTQLAGENLEEAMRQRQ